MWNKMLIPHVNNKKRAKLGFFYNRKNPFVKISWVGRIIKQLKI